MDNNCEVENSNSKVFRCQGKKFHLTYRSWLPMPAYLNWLETIVGTLKWYSIVHENGHANQEMDYQHTHVAFEVSDIGYSVIYLLHQLQVERRISKRSPQVFDYQGIHPHIKTISSQAQTEQVWHYHEKEPVELFRSDFSPVQNKDFFQQLIQAPTLVDAIQIAGVPVKTVQDVKTIRTDRAVAQTIPPLEISYSWTLEAPEAWRVLLLTGPTGTGKTRWALAQFASPLLVSHMEDLKQFWPNQHDGIVFDDMSFKGISAEIMIHLLDWEMPRTLNVKHGSVTIPAKTRKIFTTNLDFLAWIPSAIPDQHIAAIRRRVTIIQVNGPVFSDQLQPEEDGTNPLPADEEQLLNDFMPLIENWSQSV